MAEAVERNDLDRVLGLITEQEIVAVACELVSRPSPTGYERNVAEYVSQWFEDIGLDSIRQDISEDRMNSIGVLKGTGNGVNLALNGHMDVPYSGAEDDLLYMDEEQFRRPAHTTQPFVKDGFIHGVGVGNMKASLAALMVAMKALKTSGVSLKGDLIATAVCGEIGRTPVGRFQGVQYEGAGFGSRYAVTHGPHPDYAICVDNSGLKLTWVQPGVMYLRVKVAGLPGGAWATGTSTDRAKSQNAIIKMIAVIDAVEKWAADYHKRAVYECPGGTVKPSAAITSIEAGTPYKASMRPGICNITLIVMTPPDVKPRTIVRELQDATRATGVDAEVKMHLAYLGYEAEGVSGLVDVIQTAHKKLHGKEVEICDPPYCSVWTDTNIYNQNGIPCVKLGLGWSAEDRLKIGNDAYDMHRIDDMVKGSRLYAAMAMEVCSREKLP
jgi:acetylornithine deacetylase/succinyl-diaminopimelate desuccinylase-like protein